MKMEVLKEGAAKVALDIHSADYLRRISNQALDQGIFSYSLSELALFVREDITDFEAKKIFQTAWQELGQTIPSKNNALIYLISIFLSAIAKGEVSSRNGFEKLYKEVLRPTNILTPDGNEKYVGSAVGFEILIGLYYAFDDIEEKPGIYKDNPRASYLGMFGDAARCQLEKDILKYSKIWLKEYSSKIKNF